MHPILFQFGSFTLRSFGLMMAIGFGLAWWAAARLGRGTHRNADYLSSLTVAIMLSGILGARLAYVAEHWSAEFAGHPAAILRIDQGGLMFYGGLAGAALAAGVFVRRHRERLLDVSDLLLAVLPLGHALGRVGCFLNGCCHGRPTGSALGVRFPAQSPAWWVQFDDALIGRNAPCSLPVWPTQLLEAAANLLLFAALYRLYRRHPRRGVVSACYLIGYAAIRFAVEGLRGDARMPVGQVSIGQAISLALFLAGLALLVWARRTQHD